MSAIDITVMHRMTMQTFPDSYPEATQSTRSCPLETDRASDRRERFIDLHIGRAKLHGFVSQARPGDAPRGIIGRFGKRGLGQLGTGHIAHDNQAGFVGNRGRRLVRPVFARIGNLGMQGFDPLGLIGSLGFGQGLRILPREIGSRQGFRQMCTRHLIDKAQVNPDLFRTSLRLCRSNLTLEMHIPTSTRILRETASFDRSLERTRQPEAIPYTSIRDYIALDFDVFGFERNPPERPLAAAPFELEPLKLSAFRHVFRTDLLHRIHGQPQVFGGPADQSMQVIGRQKLFIASPGKQTDFLTEVPDKMNSISHLGEMLTGSRIFYSVTVRDDSHAVSILVYLLPIQQQKLLRHCRNHVLHPMAKARGCRTWKNLALCDTVRRALQQPDQKEK